VKLASATSDMKINIYDATGALAAQVPVGTVPAGDTNFRFDGQNIEVNGELLDWSAGEKALEPGSYSFKVMASQNGKQEQLTTNLSVNVNSVTIGTDGKLVLNLAGVGPVDMSKIKQFN
jgi:flagellar basal-body rod modification protein FlgD